MDISILDILVIIGMLVVTHVAIYFFGVWMGYKTFGKEDKK